MEGKEVNKTKFKVIFLVLLFAFTYILHVNINTFLFQLPKRYATVPSLETFETDFWNITKAETDPLESNVTKIEEKTVIYNGAARKIDVKEVWFLSEVYGGKRIEIYGLLMQPSNIANKTPAILLLHGYRGSHKGFIEIMEYIAFHNYTVLAIDAPGCGKSTNFPECIPQNIVNTTQGPQGAYFYHAIWAALRAITFLRSLPEVDTSKIAVSGASMGGIETFIIAAIDPRVSVAIPIVAAGNYENLIRAGTFANGLMPPEVSVNDENARNVMKYFDVIAYAPKIKIPTLMLASTNDEFFTLESTNDTFNMLDASDKILNLAPNWGHFQEYKGWRESVLTWLNYHFNKANESLPKITCRYEVYRGLSTKVVVKANVSGNYELYLAYRSGSLGETWKVVPMRLENGVWTKKVSLNNPGNLMFYVIAKRGDLQFSTTPVYVVKSMSLINFVLVAILLIALVITYIYVRPLLSRKYLNYVAGFAAWLLAVLSLYLPWIAIGDRASLTIWELIERFGETFAVSPWIRYAVLIAVPLFLTSTLLKPIFGFVFSVICSSISIMLVFIVNSITKGAIAVSFTAGNFVAALSTVAYVVIWYWAKQEHGSNK